MNGIARGWRLYLIALVFSQLIACGDDVPAREPSCGDGTAEGEALCEVQEPGDSDCLAATCKWKTPPAKTSCEGREDGEICGENRRCLAQRCIDAECGADADCAGEGAPGECMSSPRCDLSSLKCIPSAPLDHGTPCDDGLCLEEDGALQCVAGACLSDTDCTAPAAECREPAFCDLTISRCVEGGFAAPGTPCPGGGCDAFGLCDAPANPHRKVCNLTGPGTNSARFGFLATDLGIAVRQPDGQIAYIFGDTFADACVGCGEWISPMLLRSAPGRPQGCIEFTSAAGGNKAKQIIDYVHHADGISTWLPSDAITIGDRMYLHLIANAGLGNVVKTQIAYSDDNGENWTMSDTAIWPGDANHGLQQLWTWERGDDGFVYIFSTKFISRDRQLILHRVPEDQILNPAAYEPWGHTEATGWQWGNAATWVHDDHYGEMSLRRIDGTWVLAYFNAGDYNLTVKILENGPLSNLWEVPTHVVIHGSGWHNENDSGTLRAAQLYGGYIHPDSTLNNLHLIVSQWRNPGDGWPYRSMQYVVSVPRP